MNWTHIFRIFESTRGDRSSVALRRFVHALKTLFPAQSGVRRPKSSACGQAERLEVRQVLSVANLPVVMNRAAAGEPEPLPSGFDVPTPEQAAAVGAVDEADPVADGKFSSQLPLESRVQVASTSNSSGRSLAVLDSFFEVNTSRNVPSTSVAVPTTPSTIVVNTSASSDPLTSSIDAVFHDSGTILDSPLPSSVIDESDSSSLASTVLAVPEVLTPAPNDPIPVMAASGLQNVVPVVQNAARSLPATDSVSVFVIPVAENLASVSVSSTSSSSSGWNWQTSSPSEFAAQTLQIATVATPQSQSVPASAARSVGRRSVDSANGHADYGWLAPLTELSWFSTDDDRSMPGMSSSTGGADTLPVAVPLVSDSVDQQLSPQNLTITAQTKVKPFREGQRQNSTSTKLVEVAHQHDSLPDLIDSEDVPRALKYVVLPRGPPRKQPDTVLRIMDSDAEAHVLQRLRYSMAPRGPSTVTVEMQSPEKRSFSGPRVSPDESLSVRLVC